LGKSRSLGILGMSYKPDTNVIEESASIKIVEKFLPDIKLNLYDPKALENCKRIFKNKVKYFHSLRDCIDGSDVILVSTLWPDIVSLKPSWFRGKNKKFVVDPWRVFGKTKFPNNVEYIALGREFSESNFN